MKKPLLKLFSLYLITLSLLFVFSACGKDSPVSPEIQDVSVTVDAKDAVVYELFVRNFTPEGKFSAIIPRLPELKRLGINTIWLMPVHPIGQEKKNGTYGSPYAVKDYFAVDPSYGSKDDFRRLVREIHHQGMTVILDWVANHTAWDNAWVKEHPDWYTKDGSGNIIPPVPGWQDVADLNFSNAELRAEMKKAMVYWVKEFNIDGYRCDAAEMVPNSFWKEAIDTLERIKPLFMLAEGENSTLFAQGFDVCFSWTQYNKIKDLFKTAAPAQFVTYIKQDLMSLPEGKYRLRFTTNHDETSWDKTPPELFGGLEGAKAASVITASLPGIPLLYNGQEVGSTLHQNLFERSYIDWGANAAMRKFYEKLLDYYNSNTVFRNGTYENLSSTYDIYSVFRQQGAKKLWILVNTRSYSANVSVPSVLAGGKLLDIFTGAYVSGLQIELKPYGYYIFEVE